MKQPEDSAESNAIDALADRLTASPDPAKCVAIDAVQGSDRHFVGSFCWFFGLLTFGGVDVYLPNAPHLLLAVAKKLKRALDPIPSSPLPPYPAR